MKDLYVKCKSIKILQENNTKYLWFDITIIFRYNIKSIEEANYEINFINTLDVKENIDKRMSRQERTLSVFMGHT